MSINHSSRFNKCALIEQLFDLVVQIEFLRPLFFLENIDSDISAAFRRTRSQVWHLKNMPVLLRHWGGRSDRHSGGPRIGSSALGATVRLHFGRRRGQSAVAGADAVPSHHGMSPFSRFLPNV
jgi:hypothetical protein